MRDEPNVRLRRQNTHVELLMSNTEPIVINEANSRLFVWAPLRYPLKPIIFQIRCRRRCRQRQRQSNDWHTGSMKTSHSFTDVKTLRPPKINDTISKHIKIIPLVCGQKYCYPPQLVNARRKLPFCRRELITIKVHHLFTTAYYISPTKV